MRSTFMMILILAMFSVVGCQNGSEAAIETPKNVRIPADQSKGDNVMSDAKEIHDAADAPSSGGYRITPADPNDKRFKADPKLGGGG